MSDFQRAAGWCEAAARYSQLASEFLLRSGRKKAVGQFSVCSEGRLIPLSIKKVRVKLSVEQDV